MPVPLRICHRGRVAVVLASGAAISLTALSGGIVPTLAEPVTDTLVPTTTEAVPTTVPQATVCACSTGCARKFSGSVRPP
jgi:hypothetical protein